MKFEIDSSIARAMLPVMEEKLEELNTRIDGMRHEAAGLAASIEAIKKMKDVPETLNGNPRQRAQKGRTEEIIRDLLAALPSGKGLSIPDIVAKTGAKYPSVHRALTRGDGKVFENKSGIWSCRK